MPKNIKKCQGFDSFQRLNYLLQVRDFMAVNVGNLALSTYYGSLIDNIAKKSVLRIDPILKRQMCKRCKGPLLPGVTAKVDVKPKKRNPVIKWKCKQCGLVKNYSANRDKKTWYERPESLVELLNYSKENLKNGNLNNPKQAKKESS